MLPVWTAGAVPPAIAASSFCVICETCSGLTWKSSRVSLKPFAVDPSACSAVMPPQPNHHSMTFLPDLIGTEASGFGVGVAAPAAAGFASAAGLVASAGFGASVGLAAAPAAAAAGVFVGAAAPCCAGACVGAAAPPQAASSTESVAVDPSTL